MSQEPWHNPDTVDGFGVGDYSRATLAAVREHAASLDESALLLMDEHSCVQDIVRRCDELIKRHDQCSHATRDGDRF
jgi:hypothetical protein